jgi:serine/threonine protein kinase
MAVAPGTRLGTYEIVALLGAGGMGEVYRARDHNLRRDVAVKVLPDALSADRDRVARFEREARAVAALSHPNILAIHDFGRDRGICYAVMQLLQGRTLRDLLKRGPVPAVNGVAIADDGIGQHLERDIAAQIPIPRAIHITHAPASHGAITSNAPRRVPGASRT